MYVCVCVYIYIYMYMCVCAVIPHTALLSHLKLPQGKFLHRDSPMQQAIKHNIYLPNLSHSSDYDKLAVSRSRPLQCTHHEAALKVCCCLKSPVNKAQRTGLRQQRHTYASWRSHERASKTEAEEKKMLNKVVILFCFLPKKYSRCFITFRLMSHGLL